MGGRTRRVAFVLTVTVAAASGVGVAPARAGSSGDGAGETRAASTTTTIPAKTLAWTDCGDGFECTTMTVPLDHRTPHGTTIDLALVRRPAEDQANRIGSLVTNPGGPGGSGISELRFSAAKYPAELRERFDLVSFDPRGVGASSPVLCIDDAARAAARTLDPSPDTPEERAAIDANAQAVADSCEQAYGVRLRRFTTEDTARDLDLIRAAVGDAKLTYFGTSYGTFLGATYAQLFPKRVRALLLDGGVDPTLSGEELILDQAAGYEQALQAFLADCAGRSDCDFGDGDPAAAFEALLAQAEAVPIPAPRLGDRTLGIGDLLGAISLFLSGGETTWPLLSRGLALAAGGDASGLLALADSASTQIKDEQFLAIGCLGPFRFGPDVLDDLPELGKEARARSPHFGASRVVGLPVSCAKWPVQPSAPRRLRGKGAPPILVIGTLGDPATPFAWSAALAEELASGVLVSAPGHGHGSFLQARGSSENLVIPAKQCVDDIGVRYLVDLQVPKNPTTC